MFENSGGKIKKIGKVVGWLGIFLSVAIAIALLGMSSDNAYWDEQHVLRLWGFILLFAGPIGSWVSGLLITGFGELIEKTSEIAKDIHDKNN